jgi:glutaredoxin
MKAIVYTTSTCAFCGAVKKYLKSKGIDYIEKNAELPEIREEAFKISNATTVPITVLNGGVVIGWKPAEFARLV